jgi:hypothetical protein
MRTKWEAHQEYYRGKKAVDAVVVEKKVTKPVVTVEPKIPVTAEVPEELPVTETVDTEFTAKVTSTTKNKK